MRVPRVYRTSDFTWFLFPIVYIGCPKSNPLHTWCGFPRCKGRTIPPYRVRILSLHRPARLTPYTLPNNMMRAPGYIGCETAFSDMLHYIIEYSIRRLTRLTPYALPNNMTHAPKVYRVWDFIQWCIALYHTSDTLHTSGSLHRCVGCWDCNRCDMYGIPHTDSDTNISVFQPKKKSVATLKSELPSHYKTQNGKTVVKAKVLLFPTRVTHLKLSVHVYV